MIDYEITVDVSNEDVETKKRVQDAFFKLGITWWDDAEYFNLDKGCYTNTFSTGRVTKDLMWANESTEPTHTVDELLELAGMKTDTKPFDLERALKGEPVVLRNGRKAYVRHRETELDTGHPLTGYGVKGSEGDILTWTEDGYFLEDKEESGFDIAGVWTEPLVFEHWDLLCDDIKYLAKDGDGDWYGYREKPSKEEWEWGTQRYDGYYSVEALNPSLFPDCDWENSLIKRPEK